MYLDVLGLVTTGRGNLIDPVATALVLPWKRRDGSRAESAEISAAWNFVKTLQSAKQRGGMWFASQTFLRLTEDDIDALTWAKLDQNESILKQGFGEWDAFPAPAQLGILSMAWAMGARFGFPKFRAAANLQDWDTCTNECKMNETGNPGLVPRNVANRRLFEAARDGVDLAVALAA